MAYKYTISLNATVTTTKTYDQLIQLMTQAVTTLGTATLTNNVQANQWVDQQTMQPQQFNDDGTVYVEPAEVIEVTEVPDTSTTETGTDTGTQS
jgi:hypothetical protein